MEHDNMLNDLRRQAIEEARARVAAYISGQMLHVTVGGYENDDDIVESKN